MKNRITKKSFKIFKIKKNLLKNWFFIGFGLFLLITIFSGFLYAVYNYCLANKEINDFILKNGAISSQQLKDLIQQLTYAKNLLTWDSVILDQSAKITRVVFNFSEFSIYFFSFFTTITNLMVAMWFLVHGAKDENRFKKFILSSEATLIISLLITVTGVIYNFVLFPASIITNNFKLTHWELFQNAMVHIISPVVMVLCYLFLVDHDSNYYANKKNLNKVWLFSVLFLIGYTIYAILRGMVSILGGATVDDKHSFPYFFVQVFNPNVFGIPGIVLFLISMLIILSIVFFSSLIYWKIITKRLESKQALLVSNLKAKLANKSNN
ncbi:Pr6Pr family membrane protein [Mycoplasma putrefaciens]|uniref:Pr6Pr family membrane protein n=1 Tax=Mycoplasma putrefaciens TaxID=2123 RepID=UPI000E3E0A3C|nr:Pr6Pr family membrane protein [Mycoplasma putrefaciens]